MRRAKPDGTGSGAGLQAETSGENVTPADVVDAKDRNTDDVRFTRAKGIGLTRDVIFRDGKRTELGWTAVLTHHSMLDHHELKRREFF